MMDELINDISRGKASLSVPEKQTVPEIMSNGSLVKFSFHSFPVACPTLANL